MQPGSVLVDVAIDQGGGPKTSRVMTHTQPTYVDAEVIHYCVSNMPGAVPNTAIVPADEMHGQCTMTAE